VWTGPLPPPLVAVAHGTRDPAGPPAIERLLDRVRALRPGLTVAVSYVELVRPALPDVLDKISSRAVVVPLLLGNGYHLAHDVARVAAPRPVAPALGPHPMLARALADRMREAAAPRRGPLVLAAAGSSDPRSRADTRAMARLLAMRLGRPVLVGYNSSAAPHVGEVVASLRAQGKRPVTVVTYLLAPGRFAREITECGADIVTEPLGAHEAVARLVLRRYNAARTGVAVVPARPALQSA
jgi:sirohydrochlorin ferrochelatase